MFDILVHLAGVRENSCNEGKVISVSYFAVLLLFLFFSCVERFIRFIIIGSSSDVDASFIDYYYSYCYYYLLSNIQLFNKAKKIALDSLSSNPSSLEEAADRDWHEVISTRHYYNRRDEYIIALNHVTAHDVKQLVPSKYEKIIGFYPLHPC